MKTLAKLLYVEADEEITDLVDRLRDLSLEDEVTFVVPERARALQSAMSFRLLKRYADSYGKRVNLVSSDSRLQAMAMEAGFIAYPTLAAYDSGTEVHQPGSVAEPQAVATATAAPAPAAITLPPQPAPRPVPRSRAGHAEWRHSTGRAKRPSCPEPRGKRHPRRPGPSHPARRFGATGPI
jgi:hypothetical protein